MMSFPGLDLGKMELKPKFENLLPLDSQASPLSAKLHDRTQSLVLLPIT